MLRSLNKKIAMISTEQELWKRLLSLAPAHRKKPTKNLYDLLENSVCEDESKNTYSLALVKTYVENGHKPNQVWFNDLTPMVLAARNNDLELVKYFEQFAEDENLNKGALNAIVEVIASNYNKPKELARAYEILAYLLECSFDDLFIALAFLSCATQKQLAAATIIIERHPDIRSVKIPVGPVETISLESRLSDLSGDHIINFKAILNGETLDVSRLQEKYSSEQDSQAIDIDALFGDLLSDDDDHPATIEVLTGQAWQSTYDEVIQQIKAGSLNRFFSDAHINLGVSAFEFAVTHGFKEIANAILTNPEAAANLHKRIGIQAACLAATYDEIDILRLLQQHGVNIVDAASDRSPLMCACEYGQIDTVKYLLSIGANGDIRTLSKLAGGPQRNQIIALLADTDTVESSLINLQDHHIIKFNNKESWELRGETVITAVFNRNATDINCTLTFSNHYGPIADAMIYICPNPASDSLFELELNPEKPWLQGQIVEELIEVDEKMCSLDIAPALAEMEEHFWVKTFEVSYTHPGFDHLLKIMVVDPREFANNNADDIYTSCLLEDIVIPFK